MRATSDRRGFRMECDRYEIDVTGADLADVHDQFRSELDPAIVLEEQIRDRLTVEMGEDHPDLEQAIRDEVLTELRS